jgi:hypothetical protein
MDALADVTRKTGCGGFEFLVQFDVNFLEKRLDGLRTEPLDLLSPGKQAVDFRTRVSQETR